MSECAVGGDSRFADALCCDSVGVRSAVGVPVDPVSKIQELSEPNQTCRLQFGAVDSDGRINCSTAREAVLSERNDESTLLVRTGCYFGFGCGVGRGVLLGPTYGFRADDHGRGGWLLAKRRICGHDP
jgi:hypothetical protein